MGEAGDKTLEAAEFVIGHLRTLGLVLTLFFGIARLLPRFADVSLPAAISTWDAAGLLLGITFLAVWLLRSTIRLLFDILKYSWLGILRWNADQKHGREAVANVELLKEGQIVALLDCLMSSQKRFLVVLGTDCGQLADLNILTIKGYASGQAICELNPKIKKSEKVLQDQLLNVVRSDPYRFGGLAHRYIRPEDFERLGAQSA